MLKRSAHNFTLRYSEDILILIAIKNVKILTPIAKGITYVKSNFSLVTT